MSLVAPLFVAGMMFLGAGLALGVRPEWLEARNQRHFPTIVEENRVNDDTRTLRRKLLLVAASDAVMIVLSFLG